MEDPTSERAPRLIAARLTDALARLRTALRARKTRQASQAAIDVGHSALDLELRNRPPALIDARRFELWTQQLRVDAAAKDLAGVTGDVAVLEWIRDRFASKLDPGSRAEIDTRLRDLRSAADVANVVTAADHAARLGARLRYLALRQLVG